jgi:hypothetical protein
MNYFNNCIFWFIKIIFFYIFLNLFKLKDVIIINFYLINIFIIIFYLKSKKQKILWNVKYLIIYNSIF